MDINANMTGKMFDKVTSMFQKVSSVFDPIVELDKDQKKTVDKLALNFNMLSKMVEDNEESINREISSLSDQDEISEIKEAILMLKDQNSKDVADSILKSKDINLTQTEKLAENLDKIKLRLGYLDDHISFDLGDIIKTSVAQIDINQDISDKRTKDFFGLYSLLKTQSKNLADQIKGIEGQKKISADQLSILGVHKHELIKINKYLGLMLNYTKMGPKELKLHTKELRDLVSQIGNETFESKMYTTMNQVDSSIESLSVDSEVLNETLGDLSQGRTEGKDVITTGAQRFKEGIKGATISVVLESLGLGGLNEALGISEKLAGMDIFGKGGIISSLTQMGKKGIGGVGSFLGGAKALAGLGPSLGSIASGGVGAMAGAALGVGAAGAAGYALGTGINKAIDWVGGEENFLGGVAARAIHGGEEKEAGSTSDMIKKWGSMSDSIEGIDSALIEIDSFVESKEKGWTTKAEEQSIEYAQNMAKALKRKRKKLLEAETAHKDDVKITNEAVDTTVPIELYEAGDDLSWANPNNSNYTLDSDKSSIKDINQNVQEIRSVPPNTMTNKIESLDQYEAGDDLSWANPNISNYTLESDKSGIKDINQNVQEIRSVPEDIPDNTKIMMDNIKQEREKVSANNTPTNIVIPPTPVSNPTDNSKSVDDIALSFLNSDILG